MKKKIIVRGPALSRSGYGEQTRFALRALRAHEDLYEIYLANTGWGQTGWMSEDTEERRWLDMLILKTQQYNIENQKRECELQHVFDVSLQVTIPNEWEKLAPVNIGYTAGIETTKISPQWIEKSQMMDRIIVVSNHSKYGFDNTTYEVENNQTGQKISDYRCRTPVEVVGYPVRKFEPAKVDLDFETDFNFLAVAQWGPRKNLDNTIKWFVEEFIDQEVGLVVKTSMVNNSTTDRWHTRKRLKNILKDYPQKKCKVYLLHGEMSEEELSALYNHKKIKALVTLTHGEGFGLPIFEAAYYGLPVVAPDWSGQCDYLYMSEKRGKKKVQKAMFSRVDYDLQPIQQELVWDGVLIKESQWAYARQGSYKMRLREVFKNYSECEKTAKKLAKHVQNKYKADTLYKQFVSHLEDNTEEVLQPKEVFVV